jgi:hypothetical protein
MAVPVAITNDTSFSPVRLNMSVFVLVLIKMLINCDKTKSMAILGVTFSLFEKVKDFWMKNEKIQAQLIERNFETVRSIKFEISM